MRGKIEVTYEGYGPGGAAVMVACMTDNRDRTAADLRSAFTRYGGHLGANGSIAYLFNKVGLLGFAPGTGARAITAAALEAGAEDVIANADGSVDVLTDPRDFERVKTALEQDGLKPRTAEVTLRSAVSARLGERDAAAMVELLQALRELDEVQDVYSNADIPAAVRVRL
jgi:YebC/PmpR family DNA-binding regulatory protein